MRASESPDDHDPSDPSGKNHGFKEHAWWVLPLLFLSAPIMFQLFLDAPDIYAWIREQAETLSAVTGQDIYEWFGKQVDFLFSTDSPDSSAGSSKENVPD